MFSSNHLHASVPNSSGVTRFSYDLRTINLDDVLADRGPRNVDNGATGTTMGDFLRVVGPGAARAPRPGSRSSAVA